MNPSSQTWSASFVVTRLDSNVHPVRVNTARVGAVRVTRTRPDTAVVEARAGTEQTGYALAAMTTAEATSPVASWLQWLETAAGRRSTELVLAALGEVEKKKDSLSVRLAFGKLNLHVRATPLDRVPAALEAPEYLVSDIATRLTFLVGLAELLPASDLADVITTLYRTGSEREQISVLRALPFLPGGPGLVALAREASRTND
jgi:hypothetical protein